MSLKIKTRRHGDTAVVELIGDIIGNDAMKIQKKLEETLREHKGAIAVDLSGVSFIDSHGLGVLIYQWSVMSKEGRRLVFLRPSAFVSDVLVTTNLERVIPVVNTEEEI